MKYKLLIWFAFLLVLPIVHAALIDDLIAYYKFDESSGDVIDSYGNNDGIADGPTPEATGKINTAYNFTTDGELNMSDAISNISTTHDFTVSLWVKPDTIAFAYTILMSSQSGNGLSIIIRSEGICAGVGTPTWISGSRKTGAVSAGNWYFVVYTFDESAGAGVLLINNVAQGYAKDALNPGGTGFIVGNRVIGGFPFDGIIDEVSIWGRILTSDEKTELYNSGVGLTYPFSEVLVEIVNATYNFTSGITANDQNNWTTGTKDRVNTYDTTPTVKFNTTIESVCAIDTVDQNITDMIAGDGDYCAERDSYSHTCTYSTTLSIANHSLYVSCAVNSSGTWTSQLYVNQSTSRELPISIEVETLAVNLMSPENDNITTDTTPDFEFNLSTTLATNFTCDLYINNTPYGDSNSSLCYQEFANVSTSCGGLVNGSYTFGGNWINVNNVTDGDWDTYGESSSGSAYLYINYTKPSGATSNSLWQKKDHIGISNISISSTCWDYSNSILMLRAESDLGNLVGWSCYNGTNWYGLLGDFGGDNIYEEGMWWNMPIKNGNIATITANESLSPGNYTWYVNCTDGTYMNQSDVRGIKISEIPITDSCTYTSGDHIYQCSDNCSIPPINAQESFILINGTGLIKGVGNITNASKIRIQGGCRAIA